MKGLSYHSGLSANQRMEVYQIYENKELEEGENNIMICTDLAGRGIHFDGIDVVI